MVEQVCMPTAKEYRQQAEHCLQLGNESRELFVKDAMAELATKFQQAAKELERGRPAT